MIALRYGSFYGPGTAIAADGAVVDMVRRRRFPIVGDGGGVWSFVHIDDAAAATVAAIERGTPGIYNVVDDEPAAVGSGYASSPPPSAPSLLAVCRP